MNPHDASTPDTPGAPIVRANPNTAVSVPARSRTWRKRIGLAVLAAVGGLVFYSCHVAMRVPDPQETVILGQTKLASGSPAGLRVLVRDYRSGAPVPRAVVRLRLQRDRGPSADLGTYITGPDGCLAEPIHIPDMAPGEYTLVASSKSRLGADEVRLQVSLFRPARLLLSSDKPIYQPGQVIHLRALAANPRSQRPRAGEPVTFEVRDPKGNIVFREARHSSAHGIASADFELASELNLGRYELRAAVGPAAAERTVDVKRYVLPKFRIQITTDRAWFLPGQTVTGSLQATYFFGQPAGGAPVRLRADTLQERPVSVAMVSGVTDASGVFPFRLELPDHFVGMPQKNEQAFLDLVAEVQDTAGHRESTTLSLTVTKQELELAAFPEAGLLVPGVENLVYVLTAYPDGRPASCRLTANGITLQTDERGFAAVRLTPTNGPGRIDLRAVDPAGRTAVLVVTNGPACVVPPLLMRSDKAVYQVGDTLRLTVLSREPAPTVFVDLVRDGQTALTKSLPLVRGRGDLAVTLPSSLVGALKLNAYLISTNGEDRGHSRLVYVNPASDLRIRAELDRPVHRPGETARLDLRVTDSQGRPAPSALGICAVDESVFALAENRPGLLQQFFEAEGELLKPRYQIKFFSSPTTLLRDPGADQALAQAYFAALGGDAKPTDLEELVRAGYLDDHTVTRLREWRGTESYEWLRRDREVAPLLRMVEEGSGGAYSLRAATAGAKQLAVRKTRQQYFDTLKAVLVGTLFCAVFLAPLVMMGLLLSKSVFDDTHAEQPLSDSQRSIVRLGYAIHHTLSVLVLLPFFCYPVGGLIADQQHLPNPLWWLLGIETVAVGSGIGVQLVRLHRLRRSGLANEVRGLVTAPIAFLFQFLVSRTGFVLVAGHWVDLDDLVIGFWFLLALIGPWLVLAWGALGLRRMLAGMNLSFRRTAVSVVELLGVVVVLFILAGLMLPALAKAKAKAARISLSNDLKQVQLAQRIADNDREQAGAVTSGPAQPRLRRDFPETLFWRPEVITDDQGKASVEIPLADSITTWRASIDAVNTAGRLGSAEVPVRVFQDFFVDLDLPVSLALGDEVSVPVACYNYLSAPQEVRLTLDEGPWFTCPPGRREQTLRLAAGEVRSVHFPLKVLRVGNHCLRVTARTASVADAIERRIQVRPTGRVVEDTRNDLLRDRLTGSFVLPGDAIPGSASLVLKLYPSRFSEVLEGLEGVFQAPYGCFEQTSSVTYPNVLALAYLKAVGRLTPEIEIRARKFINTGYQRLLTFEVPGGGFDWFGNPPPNICLTAYGVLEFTDMARVHTVDPAVIDRAVAWLFGQQNGDGSWEERHRGWTWAGRGPITAFVAWALAESGHRSPPLDRALAYLRHHPDELGSTYARALAANAFLARDLSDAFGRELLESLRKAARGGPRDTLFWPSTGSGMAHSYGEGLGVETTALCVMALMKTGVAPETVKKALAWISAQKEPHGAWTHTQATILAMKALLAGSEARLGQGFSSEVTIRLNGRRLDTLRITPENSDVMRLVSLSPHLEARTNVVELRQEPAGELPCQLTAAYWLPGEPRAGQAAAAREALEIEQTYDRTTLAVNDELRCAVTVRNNTGSTVLMAIIDLGIPPGFDLGAGAFEGLKERGVVSRCDLTGTQAILYLRALDAAQPLRFSYALQAKYPLRVQTPPSALYEYYQPKNRAVSQGTILTVR